MLRHCLEIARKEWGVPLTANPMDGLTMAPQGRARERRITAEELGKLASALRESRNPLLADIINLAIFTGMRRSEMLGITWDGSPRSVNSSLVGPEAVR
jgi:integrase